MSDFAVDNKWGRDALSHMLNNMLAALTGRRLPHPDITSEFISEDGGRDSMQARESSPLPPAGRPRPLSSFSLVRGVLGCCRLSI